MGRKHTSGFLFASALLAFSGSSAVAAVSIVPNPVSMTVGAGNLVFAAASNVNIYFDAASDSTIPWIEKLFHQAKFTTAHVTSSATANIVVTMAANATLGTEGYTLNINATQVLISAPTLNGQFYAVQTLRQLFPAAIEDSTSGITGPITLPQVAITDYPRFPHRGIMIDPVRHFLPLVYLYQQADRMALYKLNRLHLLISNDQGYRLESKVFPLLNSVGSQGEVDAAPPPTGQRWYYTQDEMRAFIQYAAYRKIEVIPEVDMPGHCAAIALSYPNVATWSASDASDKNTSFDTSQAVQISDFYINATDSKRPAVMTFLGQLWREIATVFPSPQYQMGGDEWNFNITNAAYFAQFALDIQDTLAKLGKQVIAWDEVKTNGGLAAGNWSQDWHQGTNNGDIASNCDHLYLDHPNVANDLNGQFQNWCVTTGISLQTVYGTNLTATPPIKGAEPTLFSERLTVYPDYWDREIWPRLAAASEITWVPNNNDLTGFETRVAAQGSRLSTMGIKYFPTTFDVSGLTWTTASTNKVLTNLYDGFVPTINDAAGIIAHPNASGVDKIGAEVSQRIYNTNGQLIRLSPAGFPESIKTFHQ